MFQPYKNDPFGQRSSFAAIISKRVPLQKLEITKKGFKTISREVNIKTRLLIAGIMNLYLGFVLSYLNTVCIAETFCLSLSKTSHGLYVSAVQVF